MKKLSIGVVVTAMALSSPNIVLGANDLEGIGGTDGSAQVYKTPKSTTSGNASGGDDGYSAAAKANEDAKVTDFNAGILDEVAKKTTNLEKAALKINEKAGTALENSDVALDKAKKASDKVDLWDAKVTDNEDRSKDNETRSKANEVRSKENETKITKNTGDIKTNRENIWKNEQSIIKETNERILGDKRTLQEAKAYTDSKYGELSAMIEKNKKDTFAGVASALAASQVPQVTQGSAFSLGAGAGTYQGQTAIAVGMSARFADDVITKLTVTADTQQRIGIGAGYAVEW